MSVTGEKSWSTNGKQATKFTFEPAPSKDWEAYVLGSTAEVKKKQEPGSIPYVNVAFELEGSAMTEGGKNRRIYKMFFLSLKPGKDGNISPARQDGILGLARAYGEEADFPIIEMNDKDGNMVELLDPRAVVQWLKDHDMQALKLHSKVVSVKGQDGKATGDRRAEVDYFIEAGN